VTDMLEADFETPPPHNIEAEQSVLGAMLMSRDAISDVVEVVKADDFYRPAHQMIYDVVVDLFGKGKPADTVTVYSVLQNNGEGGRVGGPLYLHELTAVTPTAVNASHYAKIVREQAVLRRLLEATIRVQSWARNPAGESADAVLERAQAELGKVPGLRPSDDYAPLSDIMPGALDEIEAAGGRGGELVGIPTGFEDLDRLTGGLHPQQMIVVAARPAIGKSTLGLDFARNAAIKHGLTTAIFSLEMSRLEIVQRLLAAEARVVLHGIRSGTLGEDDWTRMAKRMAAITEAPLFIDDTANQNMMQIRAKARRLKERHDLRFVVIDYMQLMSSGSSRSENRQNEVSEISRSIKLLAKELEIPVVAMSQLNRGPEQKADKRPELVHLRESGSIEQDADMVLLLHREDAYTKESPRAGEADFIVAKHRNGPTTTITVAFQGHYSRFVDMAQPHNS